MTATDPVEPAPRAWRRRVAWAAAGSIVVAAVVIGGAGLALQTDSVRALLKAEIEDAVPGLTIGTIGAGLPLRLVASDIVFTDTDGTVATVANVDVAWSPQALLGGTVHIDHIEIDRPVILRTPVVGDSTDEPPIGSGAGPPLPPFDLRVDRLRVTKVRIDEAVAGETIELDMRSEFSVRPTGHAALTFAVTRSGNAPANLSGTIAAELTTRTLDIDIKASEPKGGAVSRLLGLPDRPAGRVSVSGRGPLDDWRGTLEAAFGDGLTADLDLNLGYGPRITAGATGFITLDALLPPELTAVASGGVEIAVAAGARDDGTDATLTASVNTRSLDVHAELSAPDPTENVFARADVRLVDPNVIAAFVPDATVADLVVTAIVDGTPETAPLSLTASATVIGISGATIQGPKLDLTAIPASTWQSVASGESVTVSATLESQSITGTAVEPAGALVFAPLRADLESTLSINDPFLTLSRTMVSLPWATANGDAVIDLETGGIGGQVTLRVPALAALEPLTGLPWNGAATATASVDIDAAIALTGTHLALTAIKTGNAATDALLADGVTAQADILVPPDAPVRISSLRVNGAGADITGAIGIGDALDGAVSVRAPDLNRYSAIAGVPLAGSAAVNATLGGPAEDPAVAVAGEAWSLSVNGQTIERASVRATAAALASGPNGKASVSIQGPSGPATAKAEFHIPGFERVEVSGLTAETAGLRLTGDVTADLATSLVSGRATLTAPDLGPAAQLAGLDMTGGANARIVLNDDGRSQSANVDLTARNIKSQGLAINAISINADVAMTGDRPRIRADIDITDVSGPGFRIDTATLGADGPPDATAVSLDAVGRLAKPFTLTMRATAGVDGAGPNATIRTIDARLDGTPVRLNREATFAVRDGETLADIDLAVGEGRLSAQTTLSSDRIRATVDASTLPVALARMVMDDVTLKGVIGVEADIDLSSARDGATLGIDVSNLTMTRAGGRSTPDLTMDADATLMAGLLEITASIHGAVERPFRLAAVIPVDRRAGTGWPQPVPDGALRGTLSWTGDIGEIEPMIPVSGHRIGGAASIDFDLAGTVADPAVSGTAAIENGTYENLLSGTHLTNIQAAIAGSAGGTITIDATAADGGNGTLHLTGDVNPFDDQGLQADATLSLANLRVVRRDEADAAVSGDVTTAVRGSGGLVTGALTIDPVEIRLLNTLPASVPTLDVIEETADAPAAANTDEVDPIILDLDVKVSIPRRAFVRGRGVDSEWRGDVAITGTSQKPVVNGVIRAVRGQASVFGKVFKITKGDVTLDGAPDPDPILDVAATTTANGLDISLNVTGRVSEPELGFSSSPPLPQDEVLSQLLFGKRAGELGPAEALALADAVQTLRSGDGGAVDRIRNATGLDVLRASGGEDGPSVTAGKYVADGVFVGVNQGAAPGSSQATVEVELTDTISVESAAGANADTSLGVNWKLDY